MPRHEFHDPQQSNQDEISQQFAQLVVSALLVDGLALAAIAARISEFGFTPNRVAALGENLILLVNLRGPHGPCSATVDATRQWQIWTLDTLK